MNTAAGPSRQQGLSPLATALGLVLIAVTAAVVTIVVRNSGGSTGSSATPGTPVAAANEGAGPPPATSARAARATGTTTTAPRPTADPQVQAHDALSLRLLADSRAVEALVDQWVPQLSAKRPGVKDDGITYQYTDIVALHDRLAAQYGALLVFSAEFTTNSKDLYLSVVPQPSPTPEGALEFCRANRLGKNDCFAKFLTRDPAITDNVVLQK